MGKTIFDSLENGTTPNGAIYYSMGIFDHAEWEFIHLKKGKKVRRHRHNHTSSIFYMIKGKGMILLGKKKQKYGPGMVFRVPRMTFHALTPSEETLFLAIEKPPIENPQTGKQDIRYD